MTETSASTEPRTVETAPACMACGHTVESHDRISSRYCDATIEQAFTRRCICKTA